MSLSVCLAQGWAESRPVKGPLGLEVTATSDLGRSSLRGMVEGAETCGWLRIEWEVRTRMEGANSRF